jgi:hypothetical protein
MLLIPSLTHVTDSRVWFVLPFSYSPTSADAVTVYSAS